MAFPDKFCFCGKLHGGHRFSTHWRNQGDRKGSKLVQASDCGRRDRRGITPERRRVAVRVRIINRKPLHMILRSFETRGEKRRALGDLEEACCVVEDEKWILKICQHICGIPNKNCLDLNLFPLQLNEGSGVLVRATLSSGDTSARMFRRRLDRGLNGSDKVKRARSLGDVVSMYYIEPGLKLGQRIRLMQVSDDSVIKRQPEGPGGLADDKCWKKRADADSYRGAGKFSAFGPALVSYRLRGSRSKIFVCRIGRSRANPSANCGSSGAFWVHWVGDVQLAKKQQYALFESYYSSVSDMADMITNLVRSGYIPVPTANGGGSRENKTWSSYG
ncbi:hypothetical protein HPP92_028834 [Vanilla planifolia]|uniref:Uncharacterized protein n=1 Tax=Vanilla planifolia TaxID=51239 RepID=A0A835P9H0_VANPL|nr:hypothetical protein HPP92_028834 [Vanilla planifolia]KAG0446456.1 hypothetical protein HPP92_028823 [Vanilla planifolia]